MAYSGSTATTPNLPILIGRGIGGPLAANSTSVAAGSGLWFYNSSNLTTDMTVVGFFTDGKQLGMRSGDVLMANTFSTQSSTGQIVVIGTIVSSNSTAGYNLSTGGSITSTFA